MNELITIDALAKKLSVSISTVRSWVRQGYIPKDTYVQIAKTYRFDYDRVIEALRQRNKDDPPTPAEMVKTAQLELDLVVHPDKDL
jgi:excisionase family DNA binding protein